MNKINSIKNYYLIILLICIVSLLSAVYIEYVLNIRPCTLCLYQRVPYIISIFICFFGYNYYKNLYWLILLIIVFIISSFLSGYHVGIENNIFKEFSGCTGNNLNITDKLELLKSLNNSMPNCKNVDFKLMGLSLATINFIISIVIIFISIKCFINEKNRQNKT
jgi:disulfide bond formation protein DsbB